MKIKKGDNVVVIRGKDKGKKGKVLRTFPEKARVVVEGANIRKKHRKPTKSGEKGQIIQLPSPIALSNVKMLCQKCNKAVRIGYKRAGEGKVRVCKKCGAELA
tara:strand:- start:466 stop:774 length:309 start_codon:yes stop_codon:yes gene_type:complete